jgi:hypothetical protein
MYPSKRCTWLTRRIYLTLWSEYDHAFKISVGDQLKQSNTHLSCHKRSSLSCGESMDRSCGQWMACQNSGAMQVCAKPPTPLTEPARFLRTRAPTGHDTMQFLPVPPGSAEAILVVLSGRLDNRACLFLAWRWFTHGTALLRASGLMSHVSQWAQLQLILICSRPHRIIRWY